MNATLVRLLRPRLVTTSIAMLVATATLAPLAGAQAAPAGDGMVQGSGHLAREARRPGSFHGVSTALGGNVEVRSGADDSVLVEADDNLLPLVETVVEHGVLQIRPTRKNTRLDTRRLKIVVQARAVDTLGVAGPANLTAQRLRGSRVSLGLAGSGTIGAAGIEAGSVSISVTGSGSVQAAGSADSLEVSLAGSGQADAAKLAARQVAANVSGSGLATVTASQALAAGITGSGSIAYYGDPQLSRAVTGSGTVRRLGGARRALAAAAQ